MTFQAPEVLLSGIKKPYSVPDRSNILISHTKRTVNNVTNLRL